MANYIPSKYVPPLNICQEIADSRAENPNDEADINIPPYIVDRRIIRCIEYGSINYLESSFKQCPMNSERYHFLEVVTSINPTVRNIIISPLIGFAFLYRSMNCLNFLLKFNANPFQLAYFIEYVIQPDGTKTISLHEGPAVVLVSNSIQDSTRTQFAEMMFELRQAEVELTDGVSVRKQVMQSSGEVESEVTHYDDVWDCLQKEIERKASPDMAEQQKILESVRAVYQSNEFEKLLLPPEASSLPNDT